MDKQKIITRLQTFHDRLFEDVLDGIESSGQEYGQERFNTWCREFTKFLKEYLPGEIKYFNARINARRPVTGGFGYTETDYLEIFWSQYGEKIVAYIKSLIKNVEDDAYHQPELEVATENTAFPTKNSSKDRAQNKIFIVHGHDGDAKHRTARFIENLGFKSIILQEEVSQGQTIIEKLERMSDEAGFAIVLYTPDDMGNTKLKAGEGDLRYRARQNVVFEHGLLIGKLGRNKVATLVDGELELPTDISGVVYIQKDDWKITIANEMEAAGYEIDFNKLKSS
ncbi:nucleotide-binding protein [Microbulbifer sp. VAAF005]|uniref:nucleotide-binding protein n=1 Tax=Microbulbifer sp. VAAF005 TaxID=3034230 RepID=UPI0024ACCB09|nr:nucleotide-binding protein [Microbulbifer sp. VAAF005]WHI45683.1 nucleotide-binding protein [Microbulbifer sp. VAAF005]